MITLTEEERLRLALRLLPAVMASKDTAGQATDVYDPGSRHQSISIAFKMVDYAVAVAEGRGQEFEDDLDSDFDEDSLLE
jgi:hypothetical protein